MNECENKNNNWLQKIESELDRLTNNLDMLHPLIREAVRYALLDAGKRVRPSLVRMFCEAFNESDCEGDYALHGTSCINCV